MYIHIHIYTRTPVYGFSSPSAQPRGEPTSPHQSVLASVLLASLQGEEGLGGCIYVSKCVDMDGWMEGSAGKMWEKEGLGG